MKYKSITVLISDRSFLVVEFRVILTVPSLTYLAVGLVQEGDLMEFAPLAGFYVQIGFNCRSNNKTTQVVRSQSTGIQQANDSVSIFHAGQALEPRSINW